MIRTWASVTFESLAHPQFRILWAGTLIATLAYMMNFVVISVVAFDLAGTNKAVGLVMLGVGVSMFIMGPYGGVIADRVDRRRLIIVGQGAGAVVLFVTGFFIIGDLLTLELLLVLTLAQALSFAFAGPARHAFVGEIVGPRLLPNAIALSQLAHNLALPVSPMVAGILLKTVVGAGGTYVLMGSLAMLSVFTVVLIRGSHGAPPRVRGSVAAELREGLSHVAGNAQVRALLLLVIGVVALGMVFRIVLPALLERELDRDSTDIGLLLLFNGLAGGAVSLLVAGAAGGRWAWPLMIGLTVVMGLGYLLLAQAETFGVAIGSMLLLGAGLQGPLLLAQAQIMMHTEPAFYGRVISLTMLAFGAQALLGLPLGVLADEIGEREALFVLGVATFAVAVFGGLAWASLRRSDAPPPTGRRLIRPSQGSAAAVMIGQKPGTGSGGG